MKTYRWMFAAIIVTLALVVNGARAQDQAKETFTGMLAQVSGPAMGATGILQITVERWSTPEERKALLEAMVEGKNARSLQGKQEYLLEAMENSRGNKRVGFAKFPATLGWDLTYAWQFMQGSTRVVRLATNRPVAFIEARNNYRTMDYPFGLIELKLNEKGEGEGLVYQAASVIVNQEGVIEVESYGIGPQRLLSVRAKKDK